MVWKPAATEGLIAAGVNAPEWQSAITTWNIAIYTQMIQPWNIAIVTWMVWTPQLHKFFPRASKHIVRLLLLCQCRASHKGLQALGPLLLDHVLPFAIPACTRLPQDASCVKETETFLEYVHDFDEAN